MQVLQRISTSVDGFDISRIELQSMITVLHNFKVVRRRDVHVTCGTVAVKDGLCLRGHLDGFGVIFGSKSEVLDVIRFVTSRLESFRSSSPFLIR